MYKRVRRRPANGIKPALPAAFFLRLRLRKSSVWRPRLNHPHLSVRTVSRVCKTRSAVMSTNACGRSSRPPRATTGGQTPRPPIPHKEKKPSRVSQAAYASLDGFPFVRSCRYARPRGRFPPCPLFPLALRPRGSLCRKSALRIFSFERVETPSESCAPAGALGKELRACGRAGETIRVKSVLQQN